MANQCNYCPDDINASGYITGKQSGVYAYLSASAATTITAAQTYYPISGSFINEPIKNFTAVADPAIRYDGTLTQYFKIDWHASVQANIASTTINIGIKKNTNLQVGTMSTFCKNANETYTLSGTCVISLATNDEIQLVVTSDGSDNIINFVNFTTTISEFFD